MIPILTMVVTWLVYRAYRTDIFLVLGILSSVVGGLSLLWNIVGLFYPVSDHLYLAACLLLLIVCLGVGLMRKCSKRSRK